MRSTTQNSKFKKMRIKTLTIAALLTAHTCAFAQFVIEKNAGTSVSIDSTDISFTPNGDGWNVGGTSIADIKSISVTPLATRLSNYSAPTYPDYYRSISGWDQRSQWNLANVHDPSVMRADDGYYYMYTTDASFGNAHVGHGHFMCRRSKNLVDWEFLGGTMPTVPAWIQPKLNEIRKAMGLGESTIDFSDDTKFGYWAPCVRRVKSGLYRMYYAITCDGTLNGDTTWSERAFIGMMETSNPADINSWVDKGYVTTNASDKELNFKVANTDYANCYYKWNAIDPSYIITPEGEHWLIYGSWHSGFAAMQLDPETGKSIVEHGNPWGDISAYGTMVNTRLMGNRWQGSEAPEVVYHDGYYYLFMAYDELSVAYNTRVVRSTNINGPYTGIDGTDVSTVGGEAFPIVTHPYKFSEGYGWVGISHCAVFDDGQGNYFFSSQGRLPANAYGDAYSNAIMQGQVRRLVWTADGWPVVMPECYGGVPQAQISESELTGNWENICLDYQYGKQDEPTIVTLAADHTVSGTPFSGDTWSFDSSNNVLTVGDTKLYVSREADWETTPRKASLVYAGLNGSQTLWGKRADGTRTYGATDNTAGWWTSFSPYFVSEQSDCTFHFSFTNYTDKADNWDNYVLAVTNGKERNSTGYEEYLILRADNFGWGTCYDAAGLSCDFDWTTFKEDMDSAKVDMTITTKGTGLTVTTVITTTSGKTYNYGYTSTALPTAARGAFLTMEKAHIALDMDNCYVKE